MSPWQDVVVVVLVAGAGIYLARVFWRRLFRHGNTGCDTCLGCPSRSPTKDKQMGGDGLTRVFCPLAEGQLRAVHSSMPQMELTLPPCEKSSDERAKAIDGDI